MCPLSFFHTEGASGVGDPNYFDFRSLGWGLANCFIDESTVIGHAVALANERIFLHGTGNW